MSSTDNAFCGVRQFPGALVIELVTRFLECVEKQRYILLYSPYCSKTRSAFCWRPCCPCRSCAFAAFYRTAKIFSPNAAVLRDRGLYLEADPVADLGRRTVDDGPCRSQMAVWPAGSFKADAALVTVSLVSVWQFVGIPMMLIYAALLNIPMKSSKPLNVTASASWSQFFKIKLPLMLPYRKSGLILQ